MIDLHCHSNISDGSCSLTELIQLAKLKGITHLAITDHDTTKGIQESIAIGREVGVEIIPGLEISAYDYKRDRKAHILGYFIEPGHEAITKLCDPLVQERHENSFKMTETIRQAGYDISWDEVLAYAQAGTGVYKQHIMQVLIDKGYTNEIYGDLYDKLFGKDGGIAYFPLRYINAIDAIQAIKAADGLAVLAHPGQYNNFAAIDEWINVGLDGIEVIHPLHTPDDEKLAISYAKKYNLIETGGSDFHGSYGPFQLGSKDAGLDRLNMLFDRYEKNRTLNKA